ncbi:MAG: MFS transporter [Rhizobiaceae bacterium]
MNAAGSGMPPAGVVGKRDVYLLFFGSLLFQIVQIGCYPILIAQSLVRDGYSSYVVGLFTSISWITIVILGPVVPAVISRIGYRSTSIAAFLSAMLGLYLLVVAPDLYGYFASAVLMGFGLILRWINCDTLVVEMSESGSRGRLIGLHEALMGLGIALGPLLFVLSDLYYVAWTSIALLVVAQLVFQLTDMGRVPHHRAGGGGRIPVSLYLLIAVALAAAFVAGFVESSAIALLPLHFASFGYPLASSAILVSAFGFGGTLLQPPLGYLSDRMGYNFAQALCAASVAFSCIVVATAPLNLPVMLLTLFVLGAGAGGLNTLAVIEAGQTLEGPDIPASMTAIAMLYTLGGVFGPVASASVLHMAGNRGMIALFFAICVLLFVGIVAKRRKAPT